MIGVLLPQSNSLFLNTLRNGWGLVSYPLQVLYEFPEKAEEKRLIPN